MNVLDCDIITSSIKHLRENVYNTEVFKTLFAQNLKNNIYAIDVDYIPNKFGGWDVSIVTNRNKGIEEGIENQCSELYIDKVVPILLNTILSIDDSLSLAAIAPNLINVVITGPNSATIKL